jgi:UDP-N-acetylmuramoylalanine--D-glutamate ligase
VRRLEALGVDPVLVDDDPPAAGPGGRPVLATAAGGLEALGTCEVVVKTPGLSRRRPEVATLVAAGVAVVGGLGLWMQEADRDRVVCITGTKGKSTTASIAGHLLTGLGYRCLVAGNIGLPPYDPEAGDDYDFWVVEVSSFQATDLATAPPVVAVTSLGADHLDWHGDPEAYVGDKLSLCTLPGARLTVADGDSEQLRAHRDQLGPEVRWVTTDDPALGGEWVDVLGLLGDHNRRNAYIARACLAALGVPAAAEHPGGDPAALAEAAAGYPGLESRLRPVASVDGVTFVDDSLSTNVLPTLAALEAFDGRRVALLVGGFDRGIDYRPLAEGLARRTTPTLVLTVPDSGPRIRSAVEEVLAADGGPVVVETADCPDLATATAAGFAWARPDGVVLLSPAAPSFGQFRDYRQRAEAFAAAAAGCAAG